jgi:endonuclease/exonuclease/phosphatase family metal-dependent hydrolase
MRLLLLCISLLLAPLSLLGQEFSLLTWNIQNLGRTKNTAELEAMVDILRDYDLVAIQEVVAKDPAGAQKVALLADLLNRTGAQWDYRVSDPTNSPSSYISERYAFLWKPSRLTLLGRPYLDRELAAVVDREPYVAKFRVKGGNEPFFVVNFHARPHDREPEAEVAYLMAYPERLQTQRFVIAGDFNLDEQHQVWQPLYQAGFVPAVRETPTTLKRSCNATGEYFNYPIDNLYLLPRYFELLQSGRIDFVGGCDKVESARMISDHVPVFVRVRQRE